MKRFLMWGGVLVVVATTTGFLIATLGSPISVAVPISAISQTQSKELEVGLPCGRDPGYSVEESSDEVVIAATLKPRPGDCGIGLMIQLEQPLGTRRVIDAKTAQPVAVQNRIEHTSD